MANDAAESNQVTEIPEKKGPGPLVKLAKGWKRGKSVIKYGGGAVLAVGAMAVAVPFLGTVMLCSLAIGAVAFIATMIMALQYARKKTPLGDMLGPIFAKTAQMMQESAEKQASEPSPAAEPKAKPSTAKGGSTSTKQTSSTSGNQPTGETLREYRLWDVQGHVYIFTDEPTVTDLIKANNGTSTAGLFGVPNDTKVNVVLDENNEAVRVRILTGERQGTEGWVCRSSVVAAERLAS